MRLKKIKLAGFKSFVDPTTLELRSNLVCVVGPNGCGKSNIIDAVRWVMGESSAKHLRGESMTDVIFNGSTTRKPVGQASIELLFDNSDGSLGGEYASYSEISIRRQVTRDAQVSYFLNGTRCRRRDITDIFLGTGLGPRSYAIIEQGMISRVIEAKPEDLRSFFEEAAGIALYKKRRQETDTRMRHTRENLERLEDIRQEQEKQIERLKRQAEAAERYQQYTQEKIYLEASITAFRLKRLEENQGSYGELVRMLTNQLEEKQAARANLELSLEKLRLEHIEKQDIFNEVQTRYYELGAQIARLEQTLQHHREREQQLRKDIQEAEFQCAQTQIQIEQDKLTLEDLKAEMLALDPDYEALVAMVDDAAQVSEDAEEAMRLWNERWEDFQLNANDAQRKAEVEKLRLEQFEKQIREGENRIHRLSQEQRELDVTEWETALTEAETEKYTLNSDAENIVLELKSVTEQLNMLQQKIRQDNESLNEIRREIQMLKGQQAAAESLQAAAFGKSDVLINAWIAENDLIALPRLAERLKVDKGWELAVETVLGSSLDAICVPELTDPLFQVEHLNEGKLMLLKTAVINDPHSEPAFDTLLLSKITSDLPLSHLLKGIYFAEDLTQARVKQASLKAGESVVTRSGICLGSNWLRLHRGQDGQSGILEREQTLKQIIERLNILEPQELEILASLETAHVALSELTQQTQTLQKTRQDTDKLIATCQAKSDSLKMRLEHAKIRISRILEESSEHKYNLSQAQEESAMARMILQEALDAMEAFTLKRTQLQKERENLKNLLVEANLGAKAHKDKVHQLALKRQTLHTQNQATSDGILRLEKQQASAQTRYQAISEALKEFDLPQSDIRIALEEVLEKRLLVESELQIAREFVETIDQNLRGFEKQRQSLEQEAESFRAKLESSRVEWQMLDVKRENLLEKLQETPHTLPDLLAALAPNFNETEEEKNLEQIGSRIQKLGAINLAAIEEYQSEAERKNYLDMQHNDLTEALLTLENAIRKIDKETRARFKETFDKVNEQFQVLFPKLFGGGQAYLELVGEDLLEAGVGVMARPPGKRNSSIHLLSGGEKALTAVSLVFSIFQLNPAPFCMLDEVDAPLDDSNVGRFCELVKHMSKSVQFIFITHNKLAMEMAEHLAGVTMKEPGVSRLVCVDVEEAAALIAS